MFKNKPDVIGFNEKNNNIEFLESSQLINQALLKYKELEKGKITQEELNNWLQSDDAFGEHDKESFNCHSFVLMVMKKELGVESIKSFDDIYMDKKKWIDENGELYEEGYNEHITEEFPGDNDKRMQKLKEFERIVIENSEKFSLKNSADKEKTMKEIIEKLKKENLSRFVFMFETETEESHYDFHSFIILGLNSKGNDIVVLEKEMPGDTIQITTMFNILSRRGQGINQSININIPNQNITNLYPK